MQWNIEVYIFTTQFVFREIWPWDPASKYNRYSKHYFNCLQDSANKHLTVQASFLRCTKKELYMDCGGANILVFELSKGDQQLNFSSNKVVRLSW